MSEGKLTRIQREVGPWQQHNFPDSTLLEPFAGIVEEWGEYVEDESKMADAIGDIVIYTCDACRRVGLDAQQLFQEGQAAANDSNFEFEVFKDMTDLESLIFSGRLLHSALKLQQGIRGTRDEHIAKLRSLLVEMFAQLYCDAHEFLSSHVDVIALDTWERVSRRDWQTDKLRGGE
jgi:hypothetical protein